MKTNHAHYQDIIIVLYNISYILGNVWDFLMLAIEFLLHYNLHSWIVAFIYICIYIIHKNEQFMCNLFIKIQFQYILTNFG